jgi:hypothetical protein
MIKLNCIAPACLLILSGCAYQVPTNIKPSYNVYTAYDDKIPGHAAIFVDASKGNETIKVTGLACSAHTFPVEARDSIQTAIVETLKNLMDEVQKVERPLTSSQLADVGSNVMVMVALEDMDIDLMVIPGFWTATMKSEAEIVLGVKVDTKDGRKVGTMVTGRGESTADSGGACEGGSIAIGEALEKALKQALSQMGEAISNSDRLRTALRGSGKKRS